MADEQVAPESDTSDTPDDGAVSASEGQVAPEKPSEKSKRGTEFVDFENDSREDIKRRFDGIYGRVKTMERGQKSLIEHNQQIADKLDEVMNRVDKSGADSRLSGLETKRKQALDDGNMDAYSTINDQIVDLRVKSQTVVEKPQTIKPVDSGEVETINAWTYATDDAGQLVRPWAVDPSKQDELQHTAKQAREVVGEDASMHDVLDQIDQQMRVKPQGGNVMSGGDPPPKKGGLPTLSAEQKLAASNMGISEDAYAKQVANLGTA